jgi:uncharacterized protein (DUF1778 family)
MSNLAEVTSAEYKGINGHLSIPISAPPRKEMKVTFRVLAKTYSILEDMAKTSGTRLSEFMNQVSLQYIDHVYMLHELAEHYYKCTPEERRRILEHEEKIPKSARYFNLAILYYPDEERFTKGENE